MKYFERTTIAAAMAVLGVLAVGMAFSSPVQAARDDRAASEKFFQEAKRYWQNGEGDANAAVIQLKNALQNDRDHVEARKLLGEIYLRMGNGPAAEKELPSPRPEIWRESPPTGHPCVSTRRRLPAC